MTRPPRALRLGQMRIYPNAGQAGDGHHAASGSEATLDAGGVAGRGTPGADGAYWS
jgi:hypothetical protein